MSAYAHLHDPAGLVADLDRINRLPPRLRHAGRVGFLAGVLAAWSLGNIPEEELLALGPEYQRIAREALARADEVAAR